MSTKVNTPVFRVAFPNVFQAKRNTLNGKDEYSVVALFPKGTDLGELKAAAQAAMVKKWGQDQTKWPKNLRNPFKDQGERAKVKDGVETLPQGYERGCLYLNLKSTQRPGVVDQNVADILDSSEFYGGCYAIAAVNAFAYDQGGNRGVSFGLNNLQKVKDGDAFGNRTKPQQDFSPVAGGGDAGSAETASDLFT